MLPWVLFTTPNDPAREIRFAPIKFDHPATDRADRCVALNQDRTVFISVLGSIDFNGRTELFNGQHPVRGNQDSVVKQSVDAPEMPIGAQRHPDCHGPYDQFLAR